MRSLPFLMFKVSGKARRNTREVREFPDGEGLSVHDDHLCAAARLWHDIYSDGPG